MDLMDQAVISTLLKIMEAKSKTSRSLSPMERQEFHQGCLQVRLAKALERLQQYQIISEMGQAVTPTLSRTTVVSNRSINVPMTTSTQH